MSLWGRTAKMICELSTGERVDYFLKVIIIYFGGLIELTATS